MSIISVDYGTISGGGGKVVKGSLTAASSNTVNTGLTQVDVFAIMRDNSGTSGLADINGMYIRQGGITDNGSSNSYTSNGGFDNSSADRNVFTVNGGTVTFGNFFGTGKTLYWCAVQFS